MRLEEIKESLKQLNATLLALTEIKNTLYDEWVSNIFKKNDLVVYEDDDPSFKALFEKTENGKVYLRYLSNPSEVSCVCSSQNFIEHWKRIFEIKKG